MTRCFLVLFGLASTIVVVDALRVEFVSGRSGQARIVAEEGERVLLAVDDGQGNGLLWVNRSAIASITEDLPTISEELAAGLELLEYGENDRALEHFEKLYARAPEHEQVIRMYALALRRNWHFTSGFLLLEALTKRLAESDLTLQQEVAELAVLAGFRVKADNAIRQFKRAAGRDKVLEAHADALRTQLRGGKPVVFASADDGEEDPAELAELRRAYESQDGDSYLSASLASRLLASLRGGYSGMTSRVQVFATVDASLRKAYLDGMDEKLYANAVRKVRVAIAVDKAPYEALYDWRKRMLVLEATMFVAKTYRAARIETYVVTTPGDDPRSQQTTDVATALYGPSQTLDLKLLTARHRDPERDARLWNEELERRELDGTLDPE